MSDSISRKDAINAIIAADTDSAAVRRPVRRLPLKFMRIYGIIVPVVCNAEDAQIYALIERKEK